MVGKAASVGVELGLGVGLALRAVSSSPAWGISSAGEGVGPGVRAGADVGARAGVGVSLGALKGVVVVGSVTAALKAFETTLSTKPPHMFQ